MNVGEVDTAGNILRLSGPEGSVFREPDSSYLLKTKDHSTSYLFVEDVLAAYNEVNGTSFGIGIAWTSETIVCSAKTLTAAKFDAGSPL